MLNYVLKISVMSAEYFEYYTIILRGGAFFSWTRCMYNVSQKLYKIVFVRTSSNFHQFW